LFIDSNEPYAFERKARDQIHATKTIHKGIGYRFILQEKTEFALKAPVPWFAQRSGATTLGLT